MLGLTRHSRVREQIRETAELYALTIRYEGLSDSSSDLAIVLQRHTKRLLEMTESTKRSWNWSALIVSWLIAGALGVAAYYLAPYWGSWWACGLMVIVGLSGALFVIAGIGTLLQQKVDEA